MLVACYLSDTPRPKGAGVPHSASGLARSRGSSTSSGLLSRGVSHTRRCACFRVPHGTALCIEQSQRLLQDITRRIFIAIQHESTLQTAMRPFTQAFLDELSTPATLLTCPVGGHGDNGNRLDGSIIRDPVEEAPPRRIADGLCQRVILNHIGDLKVFKGNQVVRRDQRVCRFAGKIFTLPLHLEIRLAEFLPGFATVS